jgi:hypothetical protein
MRSNNFYTSKLLYFTQKRYLLIQIIVHRCNTNLKLLKKKKDESTKMYDLWLVLPLPKPFMFSP